ncbi:MAG: hypothetical protein ACPGXZ_06005 [Saprospiraceae bacterium]
MIEVAEYLEQYILLTNGAYSEGTTPKSGLYIDVLPGINLENAADAAGNEYVTGRDLVENKVRLAATKILSKAWDAIEEKIEVKSQLERRNEVGYFKDAKSNVINRGVQLCRTHNVADKYQQTYIHQIECRFDYQGTVKIFIQKTDGTLLQELEVESNTGQVQTIAIDKGFAEPVIVITANAPMYEVDLVPFRDGCVSCGSAHRYHQLKVIGWKGGEIDYNTLVNTGYGFRVSASIRCDIRAHEEDILPKLSQAILYQAGVEVLLEYIHSNRLNFFVFDSTEDAEKLAKSFQENANELLSNAISPIVKLLKRESSDCVKKWVGFGSYPLVH